MMINNSKSSDVWTKEIDLSSCGCENRYMLCWNTDKLGSASEIIQKALEQKLLLPNRLYMLMHDGYSIVLNDDGTISEFGTHFGKITTGRILATYTLINGELVMKSHI